MSIYYGQNAILTLVSKTHGKVALGFSESFDCDVNLSNKRLYFFDKKEAMAVSVFEGVSGRFGYLETEEVLVNQATMDIAAAAAVTNDDPSAYVEFHILLNCKNESGTIEQATFVKGCRITSAPESMTPREEQHIQVSYIGATRYKIKGGGIEYVRLVSTSPVVSCTGDVTYTAASGTATSPVTATAVNIENNSTTRTWLAAYRNGTDVSKNATYISGVTVSGTTITIPSGSFGATDIWELYIPYHV